MRGGSDRALLSSQSVALAMMEKKRHSSSSSTLGVGWLLDHGMETKPIMGNADPQEQPWDWTVRRAEKGSLPPAEEGLGGSRGALPPTAPPSPTPTPAGLSSSRPSSSDANEFHQRDSGQAMSRGWCEPSPRSARGDALSSGGSRCYQHPQQLARLLPRAGGSCCRQLRWWNSSRALPHGSWAKPGSFTQTLFPRQLPSIVLEWVRWEHSCPILLSQGGGGREIVNSWRGERGR